MHLSREKSIVYPIFFIFFFAKALLNIFSLAQLSRPKYKCLTITAYLFWARQAPLRIIMWQKALINAEMEDKLWKSKYHANKTTQYFFITTDPTLIFQANSSLGHECLPTWYIHKAESSKCFYLYQHNKL